MHENPLAAAVSPSSQSRLLVTAAQAAGSAENVFTQRHGRPPQGVWSAPGRVNLIGEFTDYNGGYVLPFAIDLRTRVAAAARDDGVITALSLQHPAALFRTTVDEIEPARAQEQGWAAYAFGMVWALRAAGHDIGGFDLVLDGGVPTGAGLSSSAAIECSVGAAALDLYGGVASGVELARVAQRAENDYVGVPCGLLDQMAVSVCEADHALFFDVRDDIREQVPFAPGEAGLAMLVIDTQTKHSHAGGEYAQRRHSCEAAATQLGVSWLRDIEIDALESALSALDDETLQRRARHIITENDRVLSTVALLRAGELAAIGPQLTASHISLRDDFEVSCPELDVAVEAALGAGAYGARMTGGGFGGSAIALVEATATGHVAAQINAAFARRGFVAPHILSPSTAGGVAREA